MTAAKVTFTDLSYQPAESGGEQRFGFDCPKYKGHRCEGLLIAGKSSVKRDPSNKNGGRAQWDWDGDREAPSFSPSVNCQGCWHGYIKKGRCVTTDQVTDEPEPSQ